MSFLNQGLMLTVCHILHTKLELTSQVRGQEYFTMNRRGREFIHRHFRCQQIHLLGFDTFISY